VGTMTFDSFLMCQLLLDVNSLNTFKILDFAEHFNSNCSKALYILSIAVVRGIANFLLMSI